MPRVDGTGAATILGLMMMVFGRSGSVVPGGWPWGIGAVVRSVADRWYVSAVAPASFRVPRIVVRWSWRNVVATLSRRRLAVLSSREVVPSFFAVRSVVVPLLLFSTLVG